MTNQELIQKLNNNEYITREEWLSIGPVTRDILVAVYDKKDRTRRPLFKQILG